MSTTESRQHQTPGGSEAAPAIAEMAIFAAEVNATWSALNSRFADRISSAELDHLLAVFIFGLTSQSFGGNEPQAHLAACRSLLELKLPADRVHAALHTVPEATVPWVTAAYEAIELRGLDKALEFAGQADSRPAVGADNMGVLV